MEEKGWGKTQGSILNYIRPVDGEKENCISSSHHWNWHQKETIVKKKEPPICNRGQRRDNKYDLGTQYSPNNQTQYQNSWDPPSTTKVIEKLWQGTPNQQTNYCPAKTIDHQQPFSQHSLYHHQNSYNPAQHYAADVAYPNSHVHKQTFLSDHLNDPLKAYGLGSMHIPREQSNQTLYPASNNTLEMTFKNRSNRPLAHTYNDQISSQPEHLPSSNHLTSDWSWDHVLHFDRTQCHHPTRESSVLDKQPRRLNYNDQMIHTSDDSLLCHDHITSSSAYHDHIFYPNDKNTMINHDTIHTSSSYDVYDPPKKWINDETNTLALHVQHLNLLEETSAMVPLLSPKRSNISNSTKSYAAVARKPKRDV